MSPSSDPTGCSMTEPLEPSVDEYFRRLQRLEGRGWPLSVKSGGYFPRRIYTAKIMWSSGRSTVVMLGFEDFRNHLIGGFLREGLLLRGARLHIKLVPGGCKVLWWREGENPQQTATHTNEASALLEASEMLMGLGPLPVTD